MNGSDPRTQYPPPGFEKVQWWEDECMDIRPIKTRKQRIVSVLGGILRWAILVPAALGMLFGIGVTIYTIVFVVWSVGKYVWHLVQ